MLRRLAWPALFLLSGCADKSPTAMVLAVSSEVPFPDELTSVQIQVSRDGASVFENTYDKADGTRLLPGTLTLVNGSDESAGDPMLITVLGAVEGGHSIKREARLGFVDQHQKLLRLRLERSCEDIPCTEGSTTCVGGMCVPIDIDPNSLPDFTDNDDALADAGSAGNDGGDNSGAGQGGSAAGQAGHSAHSGAGGGSVMNGGSGGSSSTAGHGGSSAQGGAGHGGALGGSSGSSGHAGIGGTGGASGSSGQGGNGGASGNGGNGGAGGASGASGQSGNGGASGASGSSGQSGSGGEAGSGGIVGVAGASACSALGGAGGTSSCDAAGSGGAGGSAGSGGQAGAPPLFSSFVAYPLNDGFDPTPVSLAVAELGGTVGPDVVTAQYYENDVAIYLSNGSGFAAPSFITIPGNQADSIALGDMTGDGLLDIVVAATASAQTFVLVNAGGGSFGAATQIGTAGNWLTVGNVVGDARLEVITPSATGITILSNNGVTYDQLADLSTLGAPTSVIVGDVDKDGHTDIIATIPGTSNVAVLRSDGMDGFYPVDLYPIGASPYKAALGDVNNDGFVDIVTGNFAVSGTVSVLLNDGTGHFPTSASYAAESGTDGLVVGDVNHDGAPDIFVANRDSSSVSAFLNNADGSGTFQPQVVLPTDYQPVDVRLADVDGDGKPDLIIDEEGANGIAVYINVIPLAHTAR